jgi:hypothetical protein
LDGTAFPEPDAEPEPAPVAEAEAAAGAAEPDSDPEAPEALPAAGTVLEPDRESVR